MWGYVAPSRRGGKHPAFLGYYCALCRTLLSDYGPVAQQVLNYDCAFMAMILGGMYGEGPQKQGWCALQPFSHLSIAPRQEAAAFAAAANVLLAANKCLDDWRDERSVKGKAGYMLLQRAMAKAKRRYPEMDALIASQMRALSALEREGCAHMDQAAHAFAELLGALMALAGKEAGQHEPLYGMGYNLGKWIYMLDAFDDVEKDQKSGAYNVLLRQFPGTSAGAVRDNARERVRWNLEHTLHEARCAGALLVLGDKRPAVELVLAGICPARQKAILDGEELTGA